MITNIRQSSESVSARVDHIAEDNSTINQRTESQVQDLEQATTSLGKIYEAVQQTSSFASEANNLGDDAKQHAEIRFNMVKETMDEMDEINKSSAKIANGAHGQANEVGFIYESKQTALENTSLAGDVSSASGSLVNEARSLDEMVSYFQLNQTKTMSFRDHRSTTREPTFS